MSRLWDTPEFWARSEVDEALREMLDTSPAVLADSLERNAASYAGDPELVAAMIGDLRRRAAAGIRFWPGPQPIDIPELRIGEDLEYPIDDEIPW